MTSAHSELAGCTAGMPEDGAYRLCTKCPTRGEQVPVGGAIAAAAMLYPDPEAAIAKVRGKACPTCGSTVAGPPALPPEKEAT